MPRNLEGILPVQLVPVFAAPTIKKVIFNDPVTIVIWGDGKKTTVKAQKGDKYNKEVGLAMCVMKRVYGNTGFFNEIFKTYIPGYGEKPCKERIYLERDNKVYKLKDGEWRKLTDESGAKVKEKICGKARKNGKVDSNKVIELHNQGLKPSKIAEELGIGKTSVYNCLKAKKE